MKKRTSFLIISAMVLTLAGCGQANQSNTSDASNASDTSNVSSTPEISNTSDTSNIPEISNVANTSDTPNAVVLSDASYTIPESDLSFEYNGKSVSVKNDAKKNIEALGNPTEEKTSPYNELDKSYIFGNAPDSIELLTIKDKTQAIVIHDSNVKTSRGIGVGSTCDDVIAAYGGKAPTGVDGIDISIKFSYSYKNYSVSFDIDDKDRVVTAITYSNNTMTRLW